MDFEVDIGLQPISGGESKIFRRINKNHEQERKKEDERRDEKNY